LIATDDKSPRVQSFTMTFLKRDYQAIVIALLSSYRD